MFRTKSVDEIESDVDDEGSGSLRKQLGLRDMVGFGVGIDSAPDSDPDTVLIEGQTRVLGRARRPLRVETRGGEGPRRPTCRVAA